MECISDTTGPGSRRLRLQMRWPALIDISAGRRIRTTLGRPRTRNMGSISPRRGALDTPCSVALATEFDPSLAPAAALTLLRNQGDGAGLAIQSARRW